jgi:hypothetical protein
VVRAGRVVRKVMRARRGTKHPSMKFLPMWTKHLRASLPRPSSSRRTKSTWRNKRLRAAAAVVRTPTRSWTRPRKALEEVVMNSTLAVVAEALPEVAAVVVVGVLVAEVVVRLRDRRDHQSRMKSSSK